MRYVQLLASTVYAELIDINDADLIQETLYVTNGSLGIAQIQISTAMGEKLFTDITPQEARDAYEEFLNSPLVPTSVHVLVQDKIFKRPGDEMKLAINRKLRTPQYAIEAAAKLIHLHLSRASGNRTKAWATKFGFKWDGTNLADPQDIYGFVDGADKAEKEQQLAGMTSGIHNTPSITGATAVDGAVFPNAFFQADLGSRIAQDLFDMGIFRAII